MVDLEVENTLREIRERVRAESAALERAPSSTPGGTSLTDDGATREGFASDALARMEANLATTGRAWSKLPPLQTYRKGWAARLELFVKRLVERATHWFTWEQVNFNSGAHHALGDAREALAAHDQALAALKSDLFAVRDELRASVAQALAQARDDRERAAEQLARLGAETRAALEGLAREQAAAEALRAELSSQFVRAGELDSRLGAIEREARERAERLLEEQRVCFRQLSLEAGEAAVNFDRARRLLEARLETLEKSLESGV
jgi:hypothetical protein